MHSETVLKDGEQKRGKGDGKGGKGGKGGKRRRRKKEEGREREGKSEKSSKSYRLVRIPLNRSLKNYNLRTNLSNSEGKAQPLGHTALFFFFFFAF